MHECMQESGGRSRILRKRRFSKIMKEKSKFIIFIINPLNPSCKYTFVDG